MVHSSRQRKDDNEENEDKSQHTLSLDMSAGKPFGSRDMSSIDRKDLKDLVGEECSFNSEDVQTVKSQSQ